MPFLLCAEPLYIDVTAVMEDGPSISSSFVGASPLVPSLKSRLYCVLWEQVMVTMDAGLAAGCAGGLNFLVTADIKHEA
jgi:hypothetical protein